MSQRLHIGETKEKFYDCVLTTERDAGNALWYEWLAYDKEGFLGPWKIRIKDVELFKAVQPRIEQIFTKLGLAYPDSIWMFYFEDGSELIHPSNEQLTQKLKE